MTCEREHNRTVPAAEQNALLAWAHRLRCDACRSAHQVDRLIDRGSAQMRNESIPADSLSMTLSAAGCGPEAGTAYGRRAARAELSRALALVGVGIFATTLAQPEQIGRSLFGAPQFPSASAQGVAGFWALLGIFWYLKPVAALLFQSMPGLATRRTVCLVATSFGAAVLWMLPSLRMHAPTSLTPAIGIGVNALLVLASTILGGYLVEQAQRIGASGRLGALHQGVAHLAAMTAPVLGLAAGRAVGPPVAAALLVLFGVMAALLMTRAAPLPRKAAGVVPQIRALGQAVELWQVAAMLLLVNGVSSFDALLAKRQAMEGFSSIEQHQLLFLAEGATLISILAYAILCRRLRLKSLLPAGIVANAGGTMLYLAYTGSVSFAFACAIEIVNGLAAALILVTLFDLAVRAVPRHCAYLGYAVLMSVANIARASSEIATATLSLSLSFASIIVLSATCSALALLVVVRLPRTLVTRREGEPAAGAASWARGLSAEA